MTVDRLAALRRLTEAVSRARQMELAKLRREEDRLRQRLAGIEAARANSLEHLDPDAPAARSGAVMVWQGWVDAKRAGINGDLATLRARMIAARDALNEAHGRDQALRGATKKLLAQGTALTRRRKDNRGD